MVVWLAGMQSTIRLMSAGNGLPPQPQSQGGGPHWQPGAHQLPTTQPLTEISQAPRQAQVVVVAACWEVRQPTLIVCPGMTLRQGAGAQRQPDWQLFWTSCNPDSVAA